MSISTKESCPDMKLLGQILSATGEVSSEDLIPLLQEIQLRYGYLPPKVLAELGSRTGIAASQIYGVATFYEQFYLEPRGRNTIKCCRGTACHVKGVPKIIDAIRQTLGVEPGETTEDMQFAFETVSCLGACALSPVMVVNNVYYGKMTAQKAKILVERLSATSEEENS